jgi:hypothetical protein
MASKAQREAVRTRAAAVNAAIGSFRKTNYAKLPPKLAAALAVSQVIGNTAAAIAERTEPTEPAA